MESFMVQLMMGRVTHGWVIQIVISYIAIEPQSS